MQPIPKAIIFARVSKRAGEDSSAIDTQIKLLKRYCKQKELQVVREFIVPETASTRQRRQVVRELLAFIEDSQINDFVVENTDRLANLRTAHRRISALPLSYSISTDIVRFSFKSLGQDLLPSIHNAATTFFSQLVFP